MVWDRPSTRRPGRWSRAAAGSSARPSGRGPPARRSRGRGARAARCAAGRSRSSSAAAARRWLALPAVAVTGLGAQRRGQVAPLLGRARVEGLRDPHPLHRLDRHREVDRCQPLDLPPAVSTSGAGPSPRRASRPGSRTTGRAPAPAAAGDVDDVAGLELLQRARRLRRGAAERAARASSVSRSLSSRRSAAYSSKSPEVAGHGLAVTLQRLLVAPHLPGDADHRPVGLELREGGLQQLAGAVPPELADQVDRHVVGGAEAGAQRIGAGAGEAGDRHAGPCPAATAPPRGPRRRCRAARPGR